VKKDDGVPVGAWVESSGQYQSYSARLQLNIRYRINSIEARAQPTLSPP
jgi:hypothetical protein